MALNPETITKIQTGDLLLFSNWSHSGLGVRLATASPWNHVGIAVWVRTQEQFELLAGEHQTLLTRVGRAKEEPPQLYCFETNNNVVYDRLTGRLDDGARLVALDTMLPRYTEVAWRPLRVERTQEFYQRLWAFIEEYSGHPYHQNKMRMVLSALHVHLDPYDPPTPDLFCSQLVARYMQRFELLPLTEAAYTYLPSNFASTDPPLRGVRKVPDDVFTAPEEVIYHKINLAWHWTVLLIVLALLLWLFILVFSSRYRRLLIHENICT